MNKLFILLSLLHCSIIPAMQPAHHAPAQEQHIREQVFVYLGPEYNHRSAESFNVNATVNHSAQRVETPYFMTDQHATAPRSRISSYAFENMHTINAACTSQYSSSPDPLKVALHVLQINGDVKRIEALKVKLEKELETKIFGKRAITTQLEKVQRILNDPMTQRLSIIRDGTFDQALKAIKEIRRLSPFKHVGTDRLYRSRLGVYMKAVGYNQLQAAENLLVSRDDYQKMIHESGCLIVGAGDSVSIRTTGTPKSFGFDVPSTEQIDAILVKREIAQKIAIEKGMVLDNVTLDGNSARIYQANSSEVTPSTLTDMTTDKPTLWYGNELSSEKRELFAAYHQEVHEALIREGLIDRDMPRVIQVAELFIETLAHELHPNQVKRDIDGIAQLVSDMAHSAMSPINGVRGRSHLGHPYPRVIAALEAGVYGAQKVARRLVTPMEGVDKSPLVQLLRAAGDLTPEQIAIISAKATADLIKFEALSAVGAYVSQADVLGKVREVAQRIERGTLTVEEARCALIADGIVLDVAAAESSAASAAESTSALRSQAQKIKGGGSVKSGPSTLKPLGLGSTGRSVAKNLTEKLAMEEIMSNPAMGRIVKEGLKDQRWKGWTKMSNRTAHDVEIHYVGKWENGILAAVDDFKFVGD